MAGEVEHLAAEAPLVVVPSHELNEVIVKSETGLCIENAGVGIGDEVGGDDILVDILDNALHRAFGGCLDGGADLIVACTLFEAAGEVNDGDIGAGDAHGGAGQLAVELGDDLADSLGCAGGGGDDVAVNATTQAPILLGEAVNNFLSRGVGVYGGHETLNDAEVVINDFGEGSEAVGGARCVGNHLYVGSVAVKIDTANEHRGIVLGRTGQHDDLCACIDVSLGFLGGEESTGALEDILNAHLAPRQLCGVAVADDGNTLAVYGDGAVVGLDGAVKAAVHGVVLYGVGQLSGGLIGSVDRNDLDIVRDDSCSENETTDAAETIDCYFDHNLFLHYNIKRKNFLAI